MTDDDEKLVDAGAVRLFMAQEETDDEAYARQVLGIGEELEHCGDCTKSPMTCQLCVREEYQRMMRAALRAIDVIGASSDKCGIPAQQPLSAPQIVPWLAPLEERLLKRILALEAEVRELRTQISDLCERERDDGV